MVRKESGWGATFLWTKNNLKSIKERVVVLEKKKKIPRCQILDSQQ